MKQGQIWLNATFNEDTDQLLVKITNTSPVKRPNTTKLVTDKQQIEETSKGLGLTICHKIVESIGGQISVEISEDISVTTLTYSLKAIQYGGNPCDEPFTVP